MRLRADSVHMILDTYERLEQAHGPRDRRLRIEHADLIDAADLPRFAQLKVIADMQPSFCCGEDGSNFDPAEQVPVRSLALLTAKRRRAGVQQRLAMHLAPRSLRCRFSRR